MKKLDVEVLGWGGYTWSAAVVFASCTPFPLVFSLRQMEQGGIDLQKAEEETKAQISAVNSQKVAIVAEFMAHMKVLSRVNTEGSIYTDSMLHEMCILKPFLFIQLSPSLFPSPAEG